MLRVKPKIESCKLNLGCGPIQPADWINVDASLRAKFASKFAPIDRLLTRTKLLPPTEFNNTVRIINLLKPLPFADESVDAIYAGELWEHFELNDAKKLTQECFRVLQRGGTLRLCVPDGVDFWRNYLKKYDEEIQKPKDQRCAKSLQNHVALYFGDICTRRKWLGSMGHVHKWQYDQVQLINLMQNCGFAEVSRQKFHESRIEGIEAVERSDFLIVEGVKQ